MPKAYRSPKTIVKESPKGGKGFFALEDISKGETVAIKNGHIVDEKQAAKLDEKLGDFSLQISDDFYICPTSIEDVEDVVICINHSCQPNIGMDGQVSYIAMCNIKKGEELCLDYAMAIDGDYEMKCACGSANCRGRITGKDWQIEALQKRYDQHFSWFIYKKIHGIN
jgi:uncharacterized protein